MFDSHLHIIDPRFPIVANNGYLPPVFTVADYRARVAELGLPIAGGVVVSGSFQGLDTSYLLDSLELLGDGFVGVANVADDISDVALGSLAAAGVRGIRFNLVRGVGSGSSAADTAAAMLALGLRAWDVARVHSELYVDAGDLPQLEPTLAQLPHTSVDHLGLSDSLDGRAALLRLVERGTRVKATGFGRLDLDVVGTLRSIHGVSPLALMFGTDLPSTRARRPFEAADLDVVTEALGEAATTAVSAANARAFYRMPSAT